MVRQFSKDEIERIKNDEGSISTRGVTKGQLKADAKEQIAKLERTLLFADVYEQYESEKREAKKMDFNDLIIELLLALREDELLLRLIQERYLYIHVDEHQDTNDAQNFILSLIAEFFDTPNIFIVGDEKQAIYRFQGASVENFLKLQKKWPNMEVIKLDQNYRSHQSILDGSFAMIEKNYEEDENNDLRVKLKASGQEKSQPIEIITGENTAAIELYLIERLKRLETDSKPTVAIIVRRNRDLDRIIRLCEFHGVAISSERSIDIFNHPVGRIFFDLLEYIIDPTRVDLVANTIVAGMWDLDFATCIEIVKKLRSGTFDEFETKIPGLSSIRAALLSNGSIEFIINAGEKSGYTSIIDCDPIYINVWRGIVSLAESLARDGEISDPHALITRLLAYRTSAETRTVKVSVGAPDLPIQAMTAHGSKGLEFDYVFIPYATEEAWIGRPRGASFVLPKKRTSESEVKDIRRLFYVAITRARKHAVIMTSLEESDGKALVPLRFIDELDKEHVVAVALPRVGAEKLYETSDLKNRMTDGIEASAENSEKNIIDEKILDITKQTLTKKGLSVTALNHFIECPNKFIYQSILKMPQAPSVAAEKGTAMHEALAKVWTTVSSLTTPVQNAEEIEKIMDESVEGFFKKSLLSVKEKDTAKNELIENMPDVAKALVPHFALKDEKSAIFTETWVETSIKESGIDIPLHGKLDAILDDGHEVKVFDYKTKLAMSENAIKGETKNSDGNYFRQLVFYKILVGDDRRWKNRRVTPALVFVSPDTKGRCPTIALPITDQDEKDVKDHIHALVDSVWTAKITRSFCDDPKCEWCGLRRV
jgi:DNA helicase-2/ATP-dependent DNA helicase PcrA